LGQALSGALTETAAIGAIVFVMMVVVELANVRLRGALPRLLGEGRWRGYAIAALLGLMPGCAGSFLAVTLYGHGALTFGALATALVATVGDEGFLMLSWFPRQAILLFGLLLGVGLIVGALTDFVRSRTNLATFRDCDVEAYHPGRETWRHFLSEHVYEHVLKHHLPRILAWTFPALLLASLAGEYGESLRESAEGVSWRGFTEVLVSGTWGLIPASGPHIFIVKLFRDGVAPLSVLVSNSISQSGHALLPLLAVSWRDAVAIDLILLAAALIVGLALMTAGV
jgi:hypothetical protein